MLGISRSILYYTPSVASSNDLAIMRAMDQLYLEDPTRGTRRMSKALLRLGFKAGRDKARSLMRIVRKNQVWALDITYVPMPRGFMYLLVIMDLHSRYVVGWSLSNTMEAEWVVNTLDEAVQTHGKPEIINSDQGTQFTSDEYIGYVKSLETVKISMDGKGRATDNAFIERFLYHQI